MRDRLSPLPSFLIPALAALVLAASACSPPADRGAGGRTPPPAEIVRPLPVGDRVEASITAAQVHVYEVVVEAGAACGLEVDQDGADVELDLLAPDGTRIASIDSYTGDTGVEHLFWIAETSGLHRVEVRLLSAEKGGRPGGYAIAWTVPPRPPTDGDRLRLEADRTFEQAFRLVNRSAPTKAETAAAAAAFSRAAELFGRLGQRVRQSQALDAAAFLYLNRLQEWEAAEAASGRAAELYRESGRSRDEGRVLGLRADALTRLNRHREAIAAYRAAASLYEDGTVDDPRALAEVYNDLGLLFSLRGEHEEALTLYERSLEVSAVAGLEPHPRVKENLGQVHLSTGDPRLALHWFEEAIELARRQGEDDLMAWSLNKKCKALQELGRLDAAERCVREAVGLHRRTGDRRGEAYALVVHGQIADQRGDLDTARRTQREVLQVYRELGQPLSSAIVLGNLGWIEVDARNPETALRHFHRALPVLEEAGRPWDTVSVLGGLAKAYGQLSRLDEALEWNRRALRVSEELRSGPAAPVHRALALAQRHPTYDYQVELLMRLHEREPDAGWDARALSACEAARARSLLETLNHFPLDPAESGGGLAAEEAHLEERLTALEKRRSDLLWDGEGEVGEAARALESEIEELTLAWQRIRARRSELHAGAAAVPLEAEEIRRRAVDEGTLMLSYHLGRERSFLWAVTSQRVDSHVLPPRREIETLARRVHDLAAESRRHTRRIPTERALFDLSRVLLAPIADRLPEARRLLVVGEGALLYVPFAALPRPGVERPLVAEHEVVVLPSASTLVALRRRVARRPAARGVVAVIADPVFQPDDPRLGGLPQAVSKDWEEALQRSGESFERLPHSRLEAVRLLDLAPPGERFLATGFDASLDTVLSGALAGYRVVHLATHAWAYADRPAASGLMLSRFTDDGTPRPGELRSDQIYRLHIPAELVTLSACRTALGREIRGEGLVGLTHGFLAAGSARVLVSLWDVGDASTAVLMERFYRGLFRDGLTPAAALQAAQLSMAGEAQWRAPYHWAGFILLGEPR